MRLLSDYIMYAGTYIMYCCKIDNIVIHTFIHLYIRTRSITEAHWAVHQLTLRVRLAYTSKITSTVAH